MDNIYLIVLQSMQLSVVFFLIIFACNSKLSNAVGTGSLSDDRFVTANKSLRLIAGGFFFNLVYLYLEIRSRIQNSDLSARHILIFDVLTTVCFVMGAMFMRADTASKRRAATLSVRCTILLLAALIVLYFNWNKGKYYTLLFYLFNFAGYGLTTYYLYRKMVIRKETDPQPERNLYVFSGFLVWSFLQLLTPVLSLIIDDLKKYETSIHLFGFSSSILCKGIILFGLYDFVAKAARYATEKLEERTEELKQKTVELKKNVQLLENQSERLRQLYKLIDNVYALRENDKLIGSMLGHLTDSPIFNFDYAIFYEVDRFQEFIAHKEGRSRAKTGYGIEAIEKWVGGDVLSLDHHEILSKTAGLKQKFHVKGNIVNGIAVDLEEKDCILNKGAYDQYQHNRLDRIFIPVVGRDLALDAKTTELSMINQEVIAVIEAGFNMEMPHYNPSALSDMEPELLFYLKDLYNCYVRNRSIEELQAIKKDIELFEKDATHIGFMDEILRKCARELNADMGDVSFLSMDGTAFWLEGSLTFGKDLTIKKLKEIRSKATSSRIGIFRHVINTKEPYYSNDVAGDPHYIYGLENVQSMLCVPLIYGDTILGALNLYSYQPDHFSDLKQGYVSKVVDCSIGVFHRLKLFGAVRSLVIPYSIYDTQKIYKATFDLISKYYACPYFAIWEGNEENNRIYKVAYASSNMQLQEYSGVSDFSKDVYNLKKLRVVSFDDIEESELNRLEEGVKSGFKSIIYVPLGKSKGISRFITLFSKVKLGDLFPEDKIFFGQLAAKLILSLNFADLFGFFDKLTSERYDRDVNVILEEFTADIKRIAGADILLLFTYEEEQRIFKKSISPKGILKDERLRERLDSAEITGNDFSHSIIQNGSQWIENEQQYLKYRQEQTEWKGWGVFEQDFWQREKIKSLAAIRIEFDKRPLGVMFFNYRDEHQYFDMDADNDNAKIAAENQALIQLLANLIGRVIKVSTTLEKERLYWEDRTVETLLLAKSEVAIGMIHNIKNVHYIVSGRYEMLKTHLNGKGDKSDKIQPELLNALGEAIFGFEADYLLYRDYLNISQFRVDTYSAAEMFNDFTRLFQYMKGKRNPMLKIEVPETLTLDCDRALFTHVLINIIKNAIEADATNIKVKVIEADSTRKYRVIEIQDDGSGISEKDKPKIFQPNYTTKKQGTGMGLPVCRTVVEKHGGRIDFISNQNKNKKSHTIFSIYLPVIK